MVLSHLLVKEVVVISTPNSTWKLLEIALSVTGRQNPPVSWEKSKLSRAHVAVLLFHICICACIYTYMTFIIVKSLHILSNSVHM